MNENLATTHTLLTIVAVATTLQALIVMAVAAAGLVAYGRVAHRVAELERQAAPVVARVTHVLDTFDRVDATIDRMTATMRSRAVPALGLIRGARTALNVLLR
jgi:hypothetical protein